MAQSTEFPQSPKVYEHLHESFDPAKLGMIKSRLTEEEIDFRVQFENTLTLTGAIGMGNSGAVIEVVPHQWPRAAKVLLEFDIRVDYDRKTDQYAFVRRFEEWSHRIPLFGALDLSIRLLVAFSILLFVLFFVILLVFVDPKAFSYG